MWGRPGDTVAPQGSPSSQRPHHDPKPALPGEAWQMGHAARPGGSSPCPSLGHCGAAGDGAGGTRAHWGPLRTAAPLQAGSAVTATRPLRLRSPHPCRIPRGLSPPAPGGGGSAPRDQHRGALPAAGLCPSRRSPRPMPCAMCHMPGHAVCRQLPRQASGHGPLGPGWSGGGGKGGAGLSQSRAGCLFKCWLGARRGLFICRECWLPAPRRRKRIQRNKAGPPGKALGRGRDGHGPLRPPRTQLVAPTGGRTPVLPTHTSTH